ncbi:hypothetical protein ABZY93_23100 [Streptomyces smyrnaeus]|uniref:hypothetical protein n=1 Tax=Streptomyces smyrnaeus TaxID=1387713 RepID=UPI0033B00B82
MAHSFLLGQSELKTRASEAEDDMNAEARQAGWDGTNADAVGRQTGRNAAP